jgi:hypothetical protein
MGNEEHRAERQQEKHKAVEVIEHALSAIGADNREPDQWERALLVQAVGCLFRGAYRLAAVDAQLAQTPPNERANLPDDNSLDRFNLSVLRAGMQEAVAEPLRDYAVWGPVVFVR